MCTADSQTVAGRHQLYNNGWLVLFSTACLFRQNYRVTHHLVDLGWVDFNFGYSTACLVLLLNDSLAEWAEHLGKMGGNIKIKLNQVR